MAPGKDFVVLTTTWNQLTVISTLHLTGEFQKSGNSTTIQPFPGYVIKTKSLATDEKLFINVFHHFLIEEDKFPVNDRITVVDKKGEQCIAYGIAIPTVLFERGEENTLSKEEVRIITVVYYLQLTWFLL